VAIRDNCTTFLPPLENAMRPFFFSAVSLALSCLLADRAFADFRIDYAEVQGTADHDSPALTRIESSGPHLRVDAGSSNFVYNANTNQFLLLDHAKHQYLDFDEVVEAAHGAMARAQAALANLPPEQRAMAEQRMRHLTTGSAATAVHYIATGSTSRVAGLNYNIYRIEIEGRHSGDACLANVADTGITAAERAALKQCFERLEAFSEKASNGLVVARSPIRALPSATLPVRVTRLDDSGKVIGTTELKSISQAAIDAADFTVPAGYHKQQIGSSMGQC
jgi:hypothetical protein